MIANITHKLEGYTMADGTKVPGILELTCPGCGHFMTVRDNGWAAIACLSCKGTIYRDAQSAKEDT
jgi:ribosomal protein S27E